MNEVEINKTNSFNVWFDETNVSWTRKIDNKLYTYRYDCSEVGLVQALSSLSAIDDAGFKLLCQLNS